MPLQVAIQMDPIEMANFATDSSLRLAAEALRRGANVYLYDAGDISWQGGRLFAPARQVLALNPPDTAYQLADRAVLELSGLDVIWVRQDPPFDVPYITAMHLLELAGPNVLVLNNPRSIRDAPEKMLVLQFARFMPPTLISRDKVAIAAFRAEHGDIILKPLGGHAGHGVFHIGPQDENYGSALETLLSLTREPLVVQRYLPAVRQGDRRLILVEGEYVGGFARVPAAGESRAATRTGASLARITLSPREKEIIAALGPRLREMGLLFVGIDVIGDCLTEINVTSPAGIAQCDRLEGTNIAARVWDAVEKRLDARTKK